jgi:hypothetical protein
VAADLESALHRYLVQAITANNAPHATITAIKRFSSEIEFPSRSSNMIAPHMPSVKRSVKH